MNVIRGDRSTRPRSLETHLARAAMEHTEVRRQMDEDVDGAGARGTAATPR